MASEDRIPQQFDWPMFKAVQGRWWGCLLLLMLPAWQLSLQEGIIFMFLAGVLVLIAIYDWRFGLIYDRLVICLMLLGFLPLAWGHVSWGEAVIGAFLGSGLLWTLRYLSQGGLGLGDVKLAVPLGWWLGWEDMRLCLLLASCLGLIYGGILLFFRHIQRQTPLPFGPFLAVGALLAFVWGKNVRACLEVWLW